MSDGRSNLSVAGVLYARPKINVSGTPASHVALRPLRPLRPQRRRRTFNTDQLRELYEAGLTYEAIGKELGCAAWTVGNQLQRAFNQGLIEPRDMPEKRQKAKRAPRQRKMIAHVQREWPPSTPCTQSTP